MIATSSSVGLMSRMTSIQWELRDPVGCQETPTCHGSYRDGEERVKVTLKLDGERAPLPFPCKSEQILTPFPMGEI